MQPSNGILPLRSEILLFMSSPLRENVKMSIESLQSLFIKGSLKTESAIPKWCSWAHLQNQYSLLIRERIQDLTLTWCSVSRWRAIKALIIAAGWHKIFGCQLTRIRLHFKTFCHQTKEILKISQVLSHSEKYDLWAINRPCCVAGHEALISNSIYLNLVCQHCQSMWLATLASLS